MPGQYPKPPHQQAPAAIADHTRKISRLEGRADQDRSTLAQHTSQIATASATASSALSTASAAKSEADAINTRLDGANMAFLATLGTMSHITHAADGYSHSGIGTLSNPPTAAQFNALNTAFNNLVDGVNTLINNKFNSLLDELVSSGYMNP